MAILVPERVAESSPRGAHPPAFSATALLDATIVNVALPSIQGILHFSQANLAWVVNAYMTPFGGLLLLAGRMGDLLGQRPVCLIGLGIFTVSSLVCAASVSQEMLVAARFVQGFGGALASAVILGMIVTMFSEPGAQAKAIGVYGFVASAGGSIGLLLGGVLPDAISWHWIFLIRDGGDFETLLNGADERIPSRKRHQASAAKATPVPPPL